MVVGAPLVVIICITCLSYFIYFLIEGLIDIERFLLSSLRFLVIVELAEGEYPKLDVALRIEFSFKDNEPIDDCLLLD